MELAAISHDCILQSTCVCIVQHPLLAMGGPLHYIQIGFGTPSLSGYCNYSFKYYVHICLCYLQIMFNENGKLMVSEQLFSMTIVATSKTLKCIHCEKTKKFEKICHLFFKLFLISKQSGRLQPSKSYHLFLIDETWMEFSMEILANFGCSSCYLLNRAVLRNPYAHTKNGGWFWLVGYFQTGGCLTYKKLIKPWFNNVLHRH